MAQDAAATTGPALSVVICSRDRPSSLLDTLESIWIQTRLPDELIVMDDGCLSPDVRATIARRARELRIAFRLEPTSAAGLTRARNQAARLAAGDVLVYLDDDVACDSGLLAEIAGLMHDPSIAAVTATVDEPAFAAAGPRLFQLGYRLAGWWSVAPRGRPPGPPPAVLRDAGRAKRARWFSGAAMALRRDVVLANPFDESLAEYALGEDRELSYRLAPRHWLVESRRARVVHRRDPGGRPDHRRIGFMTGHNYPYILSKTCRPGVGEWIMIAWGLWVVACMHVVWAIAGDRRAHLSELRGMLDGVLAFSFGRRCPAQRSDRGLILRTGASILTRARTIRRRSASPPPSRRVLFVTTSLDRGGAEHMLATLSRHLPAFGVRPHILCLQEAGPLAAECRACGIPVFADVLRFKTDAAVMLRMRRIIEDCDIDAVVVAHSGGDRMFWSTLVGRISDLPVVVWSHWLPAPDRRHIERPNQMLYRWIHTFVALSEAHRLALIRHEHLPAGRVAIIPNAIDLDRYPGKTARPPARQALRLADDEIAVALIAGFRPEKRHDVFIRAAAALAPKHPNLRFLIVGDGPERDGVLAAAADSGLDHETLRILGARDDLPAILPGLDIVCLCSETECFPVVMLEAAASGCAFIGSDVGAISEFHVHDDTGLLIQPANAVALADAVSALADDGVRRRRLAEAARERVMRDHGADGMARRFADLLASLPRRSSPSPAPPHEPPAASGDSVGQRPGLVRSGST